MSNEIMLSLINNNNRPNIKPPPPSSLHDGGSNAAKAPSPSALNPLVKPFAPRSLSGETAAAAANPLHAAAALRAARARAAEHQVCDEVTYLLNHLTLPNLLSEFSALYWLYFSFFVVIKADLRKEG